VTFELTNPLTKLIDRGRAPPLPSLSPRVGVGVRVGVGLGLGLVYLVLEYEVFREARLRSRDKILACIHVGQEKLLFKSCVETFRRIDQRMYSNMVSCVNSCMQRRV